MHPDVVELTRTINELSMRLMIQGEALRAIVGHLGQPAGADIAARFRQHAARAMQAHAEHLTPGDDEAMTLQAAAFLEACGHPPTR